MGHPLLSTTCLTARARAVSSSIYTNGMGDAAELGVGVNPGPVCRVYTARPRQGCMGVYGQCMRMTGSHGGSQFDCTWAGLRLVPVSVTMLRRVRQVSVRASLWQQIA